MGYAEVSVNSPIAQRRSFSYAIPPGLSVSIGQAVLVPFGAKTLQGVIVELTELPAVEETREIAGVIESRPLLTPEQVSLARWLSEYYLAPLFDAIALMLPPGFERRLLTFLSRSSSQKEYDVAALTPEQLKVIEAVGSNRKVRSKGNRKAAREKESPDCFKPTGEQFFTHPYL